MISISKRAETSAVNLYLNPEVYDEDKAYTYKQGYIDGANDQKKADIEAVAKAVNTSLRNCERLHGYEVFIDEVINNMRKTIEEQ